MAVDIAREPKYRRKDKVVAAKELPGVPVGTPGVVYYPAGLTWFRYHVAFANGIEASNIDGNDLLSAAEWKQQEADARRDQLLAERAARQAEARKNIRPASH